MSKSRRLAVAAALVVLVSGVAVFGIVVRTRDEARLWKAAPAAETVIGSVASVGSMALAPALVAARTTTVALKRGDNLVRALVRGGIAARVGVDVADALLAQGANLRRLKPRDTLAITWDRGGDPVRIAYEASPWLGFAAIALEGGGWRVERRETRPDVRPTVVSGEVTRSLFHAMEEAGETPQLVLDFVAIFESDFDFTADARPGDRFRLLVEKRFAGETFVDYGRVLGAQYISDGTLFTGIAFETRGAARPAYFDVDGRSLSKSFLKSPLEFSRITSGFSNSRFHPVLKTWRAHHGIDYGAPTGTRVRATADGVVTEVGWRGGYGKVIKIRHPNGYGTLYGHLSGYAEGVQRGKRVVQGQAIGYVGSTGLATGPHLHYEFLVNGRQANPMRLALPPGPSITERLRSAFEEASRPLFARLDVLRDTNLAQLD